MKNIGWLLFIAMACYSVWQMSRSVTATQNTGEWIETQAKVLETRTRIRRKNTYAYAKVSYLAIDGKEYETEVKLLAIPFIGTTLSANEMISIRYDAQKPMIAKSPTVHFIDTYGLYILIALGVFLSIYTLRKNYLPKK